MGQLLCKRSKRKDSLECGPYKPLPSTVVEPRVREDTENPLQETPTTSKPTSSHRPSRNEDYGAFIVELESILTKDHARLLATCFNFKPAQMDKIETSNKPSHEFVTFAKDKGIINLDNISAIIDKLELCDLHGVATQVNESFRRYRDRKSFSPSDEDNAKTEFIRELKQTYENLYDAVQPIPYIRDRLFCVNKVFVEGGIEYLMVNDHTRGDGNWAKLNSYMDILNDVDGKSVRRILEGAPGFGKSTLTLQVAYDWCNGTGNSVFDKYEILILLRLRQLGGVKSIFNAIRRFILPKDSSLNERDIQQILKGSSSVLIILDGYDEYPDRDSDVTSVWSIINRNMFQTFDVVLTTRTAYLPKTLAPQTQRIRLTGFDDRARDEYIQKAVVGDDEEAAMTIKRRLQRNPVLADICQVPLFFVMFAHMSHEEKHVEMFKSVTSFFRYMIWCFHHHMKNKLRDENVKKNSLFEENHHELDRVAFEGLSGNDQHLLWEKEKLCKRLGQEFYDHYVRVGILVEEEVLDIESTSESLVASDLIKEKIKVRFYHKLFCEWYAAHYLSTYRGRGSVRLKSFYKFLDGQPTSSNILQKLDPVDIQYVFRFACGLNPGASRKIIEYLKNKGNAQNLAVLCILEKEGNIDTILGYVRDMCFSIVYIRNGDTFLLQRSTVQLLEVAATNEISISCVHLINCYSTVDLSGGNHLQLKSNLSIPVLTTLKEIEIHEAGREITAEEFTGIVQYSSKCLALNYLRFYYCLLPQFVPAESVLVVESSKVTVKWDPRSRGACRYQLHLSGLWERTDWHERKTGFMTDDDYQSEDENS